MESCIFEIKRKIIEESVMIDNPNRDYCNQKWCLIEVSKLGLLKIPCEQFKSKLIAITIAYPVTDPRCHDAFKKASERHK